MSVAHYTPSLPLYTGITRSSKRRDDPARRASKGDPPELERGCGEIVRSNEPTDPVGVKYLIGDPPDSSVIPDLADTGRLCIAIGGPSDCIS